MKRQRIRPRNTSTWTPTTDHPKRAFATLQHIRYSSLTQTLRRACRWVWASVLAYTGCFWWAKRHFCRDGTVLTLVFHRVLSSSDLRLTNSRPEIIVEHSTFEAIIDYVAHEYKPVDFLQILPGKSSSRLQVALTFDDGWADNFDAVSVARAYDIPVTIFVCPALVGQITPFWPEQVMYLLRNTDSPQPYFRIKQFIESLKACNAEIREQRLSSLTDRGIPLLLESSPDRTLSWDQIQELDRLGVNFGSHTMTHEILTRLPSAAVRYQVCSSRESLEKKLAKPCVAFCHPNGDWSAKTLEIVAEAGYSRAAIGEGRAWTRDCDLLAIPRLNVSQDNVAGPFGGFSRVVFEYTILWKAWRASRGSSAPRFVEPRKATVALPSAS
jgi:peptidoglycan/xylan/chitin deacetylase (PgdA/CDA1 family)